MEAQGLSLSVLRSVRIRTIKPEFFLDEELAALPPLARLLFVSLWLQADREGRLEDRPAKIKAQALPYDGVDVSDLLGQLATSGFVTRYQAKGRDLIQINTFGKHQRPHPKEPASALPTLPCKETAEQDPAAERSNRPFMPGVVVPEEGKEFLDTGEGEGNGGTHGAGDLATAQTDGERQEYVAAVWSEFLRASGEPATRIMSSAEFDVLRRWMHYPLRVVLQGIRDCKGRGHRLNYYAPAVAEEVQRWGRGRVA